MDVVLRGGLVYDGTGAPPRTADVAVRGDRIAAVGADLPDGGDIIDCAGLAVCPGFIDLHTHSDDALVRAETRANANYVAQGCTTVVTGNCGIGQLEVAGYVRALEAGGAGTNVLHLLPHGELRHAVVGDDDRPATAAELARMCQLTDEAMRAGARGVSTGLIYVPGVYAPADELVAVAQVVAARGGFYATHMRCESIDLVASIDETLELGRRAGIAVHVSHLKASQPRAWGLIRDAVARIEGARAAGQRATADQYPYTASALRLDAAIIPAWARAGGRDAMLRRFDDPAASARVCAEVAAKLDERGPQAPLRLASHPDPALVGKSIRELAAERGRALADTALELVRDGDLAVVNYAMNEDDVRYAMQRPWVATASDGAAVLPCGDRIHPRSYGTFPRKLAHYAIAEGVVPLEQAIRSCSGLPADIAGLTDRGYLRAGARADVTVLDPARLRDRATYADPYALPDGIVHVLVNGVAALSDGALTGRLAGRVLRASTTG